MAYLTALFFPALCCFLLPFTGASFGNQLGLCHYLKLIGKRSAFCGDRPLDTAHIARSISASSSSFTVFEPETKREYGLVPQADFSVYNPVVRSRLPMLAGSVSIEEYRRLLLESKPRHNPPPTISWPAMKRIKPVFPLPPHTTTSAYFVDLEPVALRALGTCRARYSSCKTHSACADGVLCKDSEGPCCRPSWNILQDSPSSSCPSPDILTPQCNKRLGVSWCEKDRDCHTPISKRKCCPTACNYNICV